jgi:5-methylcytosine-specific restriction endonuclease McrA
MFHMKQEQRDPSSHRTPSQIKKMDRGYNATPENVKKRDMRNAARRKMAKAGLVSKGDGKDVDHIKPVRSGGTNAQSNLRVLSKSKNRAWNKKG